MVFSQAKKLDVAVDRLACLRGAASVSILSVSMATLLDLPISACTFRALMSVRFHFLVSSSLTWNTGLCCLRVVCAFFPPVMAGPAPLAKRTAWRVHAESSMGMDVMMREVANKLKVKEANTVFHGIRFPSPRHFLPNCHSIVCLIVKVMIMYRILLVDDEENFLHELQHELRGKYEIESFTSPLAALHRCRETRFDLVISDYLMPELKGTQFLRQFSEIQPDAARMLLSGQADIDELLKAINETHIYRFIPKPWDKAELKIGINQAMEYRRIILENSHLADAYRSSHPEARGHESDGTRRILLVDGDEIALKLVSSGLVQSDAVYAGVYRAMRQDFGMGKVELRYDFKYTVNPFGSGLEALAHIEHSPCELVIVADKLPEMAGLTFLAEFRKVTPDAACILIGADPDLDELIQAVNDAHVDSFLHISWVSYEFKADAMRRAWDIFQLNVAVMQALVSRDILLENRRLAQLMRE